VRTSTTDSATGSAPFSSLSRSVPPVTSGMTRNGPLRSSPESNDRDEALGLAELREEALLAREALEGVLRVLVEESP